MYGIKNNSTHLNKHHPGQEKDHHQYSTSPKESFLTFPSPPQTCPETATLTSFLLFTCYFDLCLCVHLKRFAKIFSKGNLVWWEELRPWTQKDQVLNPSPAGYLLEV